MKGLEKQQKNVNELIKLIKENPELEIVPMVDYDIVAGDDYSYWMAEWGTAKIDEYYHLDERIYFKEQDFEELVYDFTESNYKKYNNLTYEEFEQLAKEKINNLKWVKAIVVYINAI